MVILFSSNVVLVLYALFKSPKNYSKKFNLRFICLVIEGLCNLLRVIQIIINPFYYNMYQLKLVEVLNTFCIFLSLISSISICFFYLDIVRDPLFRAKRYIGTLSLPALVFLIILILFEFLCESIKIAIPLAYLVDLIQTNGFLLVYCFLTVIYSGVAFKIRKKTYPNKLAECFWYRSLAGAVYAACLTVFLWTYLSPFVRMPMSYSLTWILLLVTFYLQSYFNIIIFVQKKRKET